MNNLVEYFQPEQEFFLESIRYDRIDTLEASQEIQVGVTDTISANVIGSEAVKIITTRTVKFNPEVLFTLNVSYGVILKFIPDKYKEVNWDTVDIAKEFKENGQFATANLFNRISLLIGEITASFGQSPLILPPQIPLQNPEV